MSDNQVYRKIIVVIGMHRSGTSAITRGLQVLGVELGDQLMPPNADVNAKGFWEDIEINALNIEIMSALGYDWHHLQPLDSDDVDFLRISGLFQKAVDIIQRKTSVVRTFGFKDPRVTKLLPFWKNVLHHCQFDVSYVLAIRNPMSVAMSLKKRDSMNMIKSYASWLEHTIVSLVETADANRVIIDYDRLLQSPDHEMYRISSKFDLPIDPVRLKKYTEEFLDVNLRNTVHNLSELRLDPNCPSLVHEVYAFLQQADTDSADHSEQLLNNVKTWVREFRRNIPYLCLIDEISDECLKAKFNAEKSKVLASKIANMNETISQQKKDLQELEATLSKITSSRSWRVTQPLRAAGVTARILRSYLKDMVRHTLISAKSVYKCIPLPISARFAIKKIITNHASWMVRLSKIDAGVASSGLAIELVPPVSDLCATAKQIELLLSPDPLVSIIIPVYGQCEYTLRCLQSIAIHQPVFKYEIIVVDDVSPDNSLEILRQVGGIRLIHNPMNLGFIRSCNIGAKASSGQYVYFLNNDTQVTSEWLDELVRSFEELPGTGLVGSRLLYPDGSLQEAGGIIWSDGSAWNYGRNRDPGLPEYSYAREVDYCSGASIMLPKALFDSVGGFDELYLPAYCEDADLALKIRDMGYRVIYQPLSTVIHFEGITSGTDTSRGVKAYQIENTEKMFLRWKDRLRMHQSPGVGVDAAKDRNAKRRVLVIDHCTPTPNQDAGSVTVFNMMLLLREMNYQVTFIPEDNLKYMPDYTSDLQRAGIEALFEPYVTSVIQHLKSYGKRYDLVLLFRPGVVNQHLGSVREYCSNAKILYHTVDLHFLRMSREAELHNDGVMSGAALEMKHIELSCIRSVDASIVHSTAELELLRPEVPQTKIHVFPLILDVAGASKAYSQRKDIVFVGGYQHVPNIDAVKYFVREIMPLLRRRLPGVRFFAAGSKPTKEIQDLAAEDVIVTGFIDDLNSFLSDMRVSVAPLRYGAGIKGKIGTAMAVGLPIVATSVATEGMSLSNGDNILVADSSSEFADSVVRIYEDEALWNHISESSIAFADSTWGADAAYNILSNILADMGLKTAKNERPLKLYSVSGR